MLCFGLVSLASAGTLRTRDGRTLTGLITLDPAGGAFLVAPGESQSVKVPLAQVQTATFEPYGPEATNNVIPADKAGSGNGLLGTYFKHSDFAGRTVHRLDETVNFDWGTGAPIATIHHDYFSIRWTGQVEVPASGDYTFYIQTDDGGRLWVNNQQLADNWRTPETPEASGSLALEAGKKYDLKYEFHETYGNARARLLWSAPGITKSVVPRSQLYASSPLGLYSDVLRLTNGLLATYYNDGDLSSSTTFVRVDPTLDFAWKGKPPAAGLDAKNFSVRWSGQLLPLRSGPTTFHVPAEGGVRLWLNDQPIIDEWENRKPGERTGTAALTAGERCEVRLEFSNAADKPSFALAWSGTALPKVIIPASQLLPSKPTDPTNPMLRPVAGLMGTYFSKPDLTGEPLKRVDANIAFEWGEGSPLAGIPADNFSVRWAGQLKPQFSESYTFQTVAGDGARLWLDGKLLVDAWRERSGTNTSAAVALAAGRSYDLVMEFFETTKTATAKLLWSSPSTPLQVIPSSAFTPPRPAPFVVSLAESRKNFPKGVLTWGGSFLAAPVKEADDSAITLGDPYKGRRLSTINAAFIALQPISAQRLMKMPTAREGVLLATGDFVDGEFKGIENGKVKLSSVLFGLKTFDASYEALAVVLRAPTSPPQDVFEVQSRDGSVLLAKAPKLEAGALVLAESPLAGLRVREEDLLEIRFGRATNLFQLLLDKAAADSQRRYTDDATRRALDAEEAALAKAAAEASTRMLADREAKARTDAQSRANSEERERVRAALAIKAKAIAERAAADVVVLTRALAEKEAAEKIATTAKEASEQTASILVEKSKTATDAKAALDKAQSTLSNLSRLAAEARASADRMAAKSGNEKNLADQSFANMKATADRLTTESANRAKSDADARGIAEKASTKAAAEKTTAEAAWNAAKAAAEKAATELANATKLYAEVKQAAEKTAAQVAALTVPPAQEKALADAIVKAKAASEARAAAQASYDRAVVAKSGLDTLANNAKATFDRLNTEAMNKAKAMLVAQGAADKTVAEAKSISEKSAAEKSAGEAAWNSAKVAAEKAATELANATKLHTEARQAAEQTAAQVAALTGKPGQEKALADATAKAKIANEARTTVQASYNKAVAAKTGFDTAVNTAKTTSEKINTEAMNQVKAISAAQVSAAKMAAEAKSVAEKGAADKSAAETAWNSARVAAEKAATELTNATKLLAGAKQAAEQTAAQVVALTVPPAQVKALVDTAAKAKIANEARASTQASYNKAVAAKPGLDVAANNTKATFDRLNTEAVSKLKALSLAQVAADKAAAEAKSVVEKGAADKSAAAVKTMKTKTTADQNNTEASTKAKAATLSRTEAEKAQAEAQADYNKANGEKSMAINVAQSAKNNYDRLANEAASKARTAASHKATADRSATEKAVTDKALEDATAATRPEPQKKVKLE